MRLQMDARQSTKDALSRAKSELLAAIRAEQNPLLVDAMEFIAGKLEALQSRVKP